MVLQLVSHLKEEEAPSQGHAACQGYDVWKVKGDPGSELVVDCS